MGEISPRDAQLIERLAWSAIEAAQRNGGGGRVDAAVLVALRRLRAVAEGRSAFPQESKVDTSPRPGPQYETTADTARRLVISPQAVRRKCRRGQLPAVRVGREWLITTDER